MRFLKHTISFLCCLAAAFVLFAVACCHVVGAVVLSPSLYSRLSEDSRLHAAAWQATSSELAHIALYTGVPEEALVAAVELHTGALLTQNLQDIPDLLTRKIPTYRQTLSPDALRDLLMEHGNRPSSSGSQRFDAEEAGRMAGVIATNVSSTLRIVDMEALAKIPLLDTIFGLLAHFGAAIAAGYACALCLLGISFLLQRSLFRRYVISVFCSVGMLLLLPGVALTIGCITRQFFTPSPMLNLLFGRYCTQLAFGFLCAAAISLLVAGASAVLRERKSTPRKPPAQMAAKRVVASMLCAAVLLAPCASYAQAVEAGAAGMDQEITFNYKSQSTYTGQLRTVNVPYRDEDFLQDATQYAPRIAELSAAAACSAIRLKFVKLALEDCGFKELLISYPPTSMEDNDTVSFAIGHKVILENGAPRNLFVILVRCTRRYEWISNFNISASGTAEDSVYGFWTAAQKLMDAFADVTAQNGIAIGPADRLWVTGHSRGAAVANLVANALMQGFHGLQFQRTNVFAYTFGTPNTTLSSTSGNIFNFVSDIDCFTEVPLRAWGYARHGTDISLEIQGAYAERMKYHYFWIMERLYASYTSSGELQSMLEHTYATAPSVAALYTNSDIRAYVSNFARFASNRNDLRNLPFAAKMLAQADPGGNFEAISSYFINGYMNCYIHMAHGSEVYIAWVRAYNEQFDE